jgi:hypothetical protein
VTAGRKLRRAGELTVGILTQTDVQVTGLNTFTKKANTEVSKNANEGRACKAE